MTEQAVFLPEGISFSSIKYIGIMTYVDFEGFTVTKLYRKLLPTGVRTLRMSCYMGIE
jgi:hypothetical protein